MDRVTVNKLIQKYSLNDIEQNLIYYFIESNKLDYLNSALLEKYFNNFNIDANLQEYCTNIGINDLKTLEKYLELLIPPDDRKLNGAFFTPTYIVNYIVKQTNPKENERCLDPSCGSGAFLIGLVEYFNTTYSKSIKTILKENITGADILEYNIRRTKILLSIVGLMNNEIVEDSDFDIRHIDSLKFDWNVEFDVIVGNPPYVKYQDLNNDKRIYLLKNWESIGKGTFNLYFAFFELGHNLLSMDGRLGYITPNNYFTSLAGLSLRQYFHKHKCLRRIIDFSHKKVFDAQTYTAITFLNRKHNEIILYDRIHADQDFSEFLNNGNGSPNNIDKLSENKWRLLKKQEQKNIETIESIGAPLNQLFDINVGIATLKDEIYFVDSSYQKNGHYVKNTSNGTFYIEKELTKPVYKISNIKHQEDVVDNTLRVITPYYFTKSGARPISEAELKGNYPNCYFYFLSERQKLQNRDKGKVKYDPFYLWGRSQGLLKKGKKIVTPTFSKHPRFLFIEDSDSYFTNGYGLFFKGQQEGIFTELIHPLSKVQNFQIALKILNSIVMEYYINITSVSIQGGYPCFQKNFIEKFTIPEFTEKEMEIINSLSEKNEIDNFLIEKYQLNIPEPKRFSYT